MTNFKKKGVVKAHLENNIKHINVTSKNAAYETYCDLNCRI